MLIKATFIGENGSLEYQKGRTYSLYVKDHPDNPFIAVYAAENPQGACKYDSIARFFENWRLV